MSTTPAFDHIAFNVPDFDAQVERLTRDFGMAVELRFDRFAVLVDPASGLKFEIGRSEDAEIHFRHLGFRVDDVDSAHASLVETGMEESVPPRRQEPARMYTSFLKQPGGLEVQLVKYD